MSIGTIRMRMRIKAAIISKPLFKMRYAFRAKVFVLRETKERVPLAEAAHVSVSSIFSAAVTDSVTSPPIFTTMITSNIVGDVNIKRK